MTVENFIVEKSISSNSGAIYIVNGSLTLKRSTLRNNVATSNGAGIFVDNGSVNVVNSTISGNRANGAGGGIYAANNGSASVMIQNSTIAYNQASRGGGISRTMGSYNLSNTIIANNTASVASPDCEGTIAVASFNLIENMSGCTITSGTNNLHTDPQLESTLTGTMLVHMPLSNSPVINAGTSTGCPVTDQLGKTRPFSTSCDIGSVEYVGDINTPTHTSTFTPTQTNTPTPTATVTVTPSTTANSLYLSLTSSQTIGGVASADEDILHFDGQNWSMMFDGSDVGIGGTDLFAFAIFDEDTIFMSFSTAMTVNGVSVTPQDIVRFEATSLGSSTAGTFYMHVDGSDIGLDSSGESIDALTFLGPQILLSTTGSSSAQSLSANDEDVLAFAPTNLGEDTMGFLTMFFDGSDVGLGETSGEDIDAMDLWDGIVYLSTTGDFAVNGVSGADEDVFRCTLTSYGLDTVCNYSPTLYFDGSMWGLAANDVDAFQYGSPWTLLTSTPSASSTNTPTGTPSPTHTSTATNTTTPTSGSSGTLAFNAIADARVSQASPSTNYGTATTLQADGGTGAAQTSFIRFNASGINGPIQSVKLRVFCTTNGTANGPAVYLANSNWSESGTGGINWNNQPALESDAFDNKGSIAANSWVEYDVTALVTGNGTYTFALVADSSDGIVFSSREGTTPPQLVVMLGDGSSTSTPITNTPTATQTPTFTPTHTLTPTATGGIEPTITNTPTPTTTQPTSGSQLTFTSIVDAYVDANNPGINYGGLTTLRVDGSPVIRSYLRFNVQGVNGTVTRATLRIFANSASSQGYTVSGVNDNTWSESTLNYNNAPPLGSSLGSSGSFGAGVWISIDVTAYVTGDGMYSLALTTPGSTAVSLASRESGANAPRLIIETGP